MVKVLVRTDSRYPVNRKIVRCAVLDTFKKYSMAQIDGEVSLSFVGQRKMDQITQQYLKDKKAHEVLSFPFEDPASDASKGFINPPDGILRLGDIIFCWPRVLLTAAKDDVLVDDEVYLLTVHSTEHLLGKHHE